MVYVTNIPKDIPDITRAAKVALELFLLIKGTAQEIINKDQAIIKDNFSDVITDCF